MTCPDDTIFALASAPGRAGVAVVRISGPDATGAGDRLGFRLPPPRRAAVRQLLDGAEPVDRAMVIWFQAPHSYTGEDVVELHLHGGRAVVDRAFDVLSRGPEWRFAEPGEFTRRAFVHGRLDLTAAEAVNDLVHAETDAQRQMAIAQLDGGLAHRFDGWADNIQTMRAHIEAYIDFPDEDIPDRFVRQAVNTLREIRAEMEAFRNDDRRGERLRDGLRVAVLGPPNAGKSSLVNWLAGRDAAIVSEHAGTTRDIIEVHLDLAGYPVIVADTAGLRQAGDAVEMEGIRRARAWAGQADLRILVLDGTEKDTDGAAGFPDCDLVAVNKIDLCPELPDPGTGYPVSVLTGAGLDDLLDALAAAARTRMDVAGQPVLTRARHREALSATIECLLEADQTLLAGAGLEIVAEHARAAANALGRVTGRVDVESLLDVIFRDFCIGK